MLINNRYLFLTVLEAESLRSGYQYGQVLGRALFWQMADFSLCPHMAELERKLSGTSLIRH